MTVSTIGWFNLSWLLLDFVIVAVLIPTILLQRRESGATLAWIMVILFISFAGLIAFWLLGTTRLHLRRRKRRKVESLLAPKIQRIQSHAD
ncbi:MAG: PLDc N-terminal domain-containing protein [Candidatus Thiodiazotropha sp.]